MQFDADGDLLVQRRGREVSLLRLHTPPPPGCQAGALEEGEDEEDGNLVLSEVHMECLLTQGATSSTTVFTTAAGDTVASIEHSMATTLGQVGLQVWRGALLLADHLLHRGAAAFGGCMAVELGAGPGLSGLVLAQLGAKVFLTDSGAPVLANCRKNAELNLQQPGPSDPAGSCGGTVHVRQLDWLDPPDWLLPPQPGSSPGSSPASGPGGSHGGSDARGRGAALPVSSSAAAAAPEAAADGGFGWLAEDHRDMQRLDYLLAADGVYEDHLTEAFMRCALLLMQHTQRHSGRSPRLLVGLERRIVFTMADMAAGAPAYDYWRTLFQAVEREPAAAVGGPAGRTQPQRGSQAAGHHPAAPQDHEGSSRCCRDAGAAANTAFPLVGWRLDVGSVPQAILQYDRTEYLELWELALSTHT